MIYLIVLPLTTSPFYTFDYSFMKRFVFLFASLLGAFCVQAQDLVVTTDQDSINCKIMHVYSAEIYFKYKDDGREKSMLMPLSKVAYYEKNYYGVQEKEESTSTTDKADAGGGKTIVDYPKLRIGLQLGLSYQLGQIPDGLKAQDEEHLEGLRSGLSYGVEISHFVNRVLGFGAKLSYFRAKQETEGYIWFDPSTSIFYETTMVDDVRILFVGPSLSFRNLPITSRSSFYSSVSIGGLLYKDNAYLMEPITITGSATGVGLDLGYDISLSKHFSLGILFSTTLGVLTNVEVEDSSGISEVPVNFSLCRFDLSVGIRLMDYLDKKNDEVEPSYRRY